MFSLPVPGRRAAALYLAFVSALCVLVLVPSAGAGPQPKPASDYLALGDSLAYGYQAGKFAAQYPNVDPATFNTGYVDYFSTFLRGLKRPIQTTNFGCPGESTESFLRGGRGPLTGFAFVPNPGFCGDQPANGIGAIFPKSFLHAFYPGSQLEAAVAFLGRHPHTSPITIDLGANDVLVQLRQCSFAPACLNTAIPGLFARIGGNMETTIEALQAAAPRAEIIVLGLYNPYPLVIPGGDALSKALNATLKAVAVGHGAYFADPLPAFNPGSETLPPNEALDLATICTWTFMCPGGTFNPSSPLADIHATDAGYAKLASLLQEASPFDK